MRTYTQMNPLRPAHHRPWETHILDFCQRQLQVIEDLSLPRHEKHALQQDCITGLREHFLGSFERAALTLVERVKAERTAFSGEDDAVTFASLRLLEQLNTGTLFLPDNEDFKAGLTLLLSPECTVDCV